jgi:hypothetical protein
MPDSDHPDEARAAIREMRHRAKPFIVLIIATLPGRPVSQGSPLGDRGFTARSVLDAPGEPAGRSMIEAVWPGSPCVVVRAISLVALTARVR